MKNVTIQKSTLGEILVENRAAHSEAFRRAISGYRQAAIKAAQELAERLRTDVNTPMFIHLDRPVDHTEEYDLVISMLDYHAEDTISISAADFMNYVEDNWDWKESFTRTSQAYS